MPTASLTGEGLKRYQRWLAVQRAKGTEPSPAAMQSYLQGEIQANVATDIDRQNLSLRREAVEGDIATRNRRLDLLEDQQDRQQGADTIRGISEIAKTVGAVNQLTDGAITSGLKSAGSYVYDLFSGGDDVASEFVGFGSDVALDPGYEIFSGFDPGSEMFAGFDEISGDVFDWFF